VFITDDKCNDFTPGYYAVARTLVLFEIAFGTSTQQLEHEYKTLMQGSGTVEEFASKLARLWRTVRHRKQYNAQHLAIRFLQGLADKTCADVIHRQLNSLKFHEQDVQHVQALVRNYHKQQLLDEQILLKTQVAERVAGKKSGKPLLQLPATDLQQLPLRKSLQLIQQLQGAGLPKEHKNAPCIIHGSSHTNGDCRKQQQQQAALPAGAAYMSSDSCRRRELQRC
jgi:hypothetical protein